MTRRRGIGATSTEKLKAETRRNTVREIAEAWVAILETAETEEEEDRREQFFIDWEKTFLNCATSVKDIETALWALIGGRPGDTEGNRK